MARHYGRSPGAAQALFMAGFTYADELQDYPRARESFEKMLAEHPQSELAESARWMLENMEKGLDNLPYADQVRRRASGG
jgi:outer membrane protein assembly factor BamD (BamD/ComL family)